jgi:acyl-CoA synthetase (AMP-forming)/AMP-acid ligase II
MRPIDYFDAAADIHEENVAVIDGTVRLTYGELRRLSEQVAGVIRARAEDDACRVAIVAPNDFRVVACTLGAMRAGAAIVPLHVQDSTKKKAEFLARTAPRWVFYHSSVEEELRSAQDEWAEAASWVCFDRRGVAGPSFDETIASATPMPSAGDWGDVYGSPERPVYIRQTSGTTGASKIVVNDVGSFAASQAVMRYKLHTGGPMISLVVAPLSHAAGVHAFSMLTLGATLVLMREFDAVEALRSIPQHGVTHLWMPPTALYLLLACPSVRDYDYSTLRSLVLGASAVAPDKLREAVSIFGPCVSLNYSQIESGFLTWLDADVVAAAAAGASPERLQSSGTSMFVSRVAIMADDGQLLPRGESGEIVVRGRSVKPYLDPVETAEARRFGWHHTGDLGYFDAHGFLYVVGRTKDNVITGGFKVSAAEVERVVMELPEIRECAVVGAPHAIRGEAVTAIVTLRAGHTITAAAILKHCRARLGRVKAPSRVFEWPELPKTPVGKIDKRTIRERLWSAAAREPQHA